MDERNNAQKSHAGADFLYARVNPYAPRDQKTKSTDRTLDSYSPKELLELDKNNTGRRVNELSAELDSYKDLYLQNRQHLADSEKYWQVSEYFKHGINAHQNDPLTSLGYWGYAIYPMIGSTASSPEQLISTVGQLGSATGFASTPWTGGAGATVGVLAGVGAGYYGIQSGFAENATEAGDKRIENFKELIQKGDSQKIFEELMDRSAQYWRNKGWSEE
ncbi:MAG: hypothetical protein VZR53_01655 [Prevotella sp.]|nr:hypothetical protein [Prevotella sp.]